VGLKGQPTSGADDDHNTKRVAGILRQHVTLEVEGIDRMYLNV